VNSSRDGEVIFIVIMTVIRLHKVVSPVRGKHLVNRYPVQHRYCNNCKEKGHYFRQCPKKKKSSKGARGNRYRNRSRSHGRGSRRNRSSTRGRSNQDVKQVQTGDEIDDLVYTLQDCSNENVPSKGK
jgi:hypothetical protein